MPMRRKSMEKIREIIRMNEECDISQRRISGALNVSRPVVSQYLSDFKSTGLRYNDIKDISDDALLELLDVNRKYSTEKHKILCSRFEYFARELKRPG